MAVLKDLIVHGSSRFLNGIQTESLKADTIDAKNGYFKYLKAIDGDIENLSVEELLAQKATVVGLLDVKGELHTNTWTNSNIANIGGVFYISPTVISNTATVAIGGSKNSRTLTVSNGSFATTTVPTWNGTTESTSGWAIGSRVMVTGSVTYNNVEYPLGTCVGYINDALTSSGFTVQQISSEALESIFAITSTNSLSGTNIQISMYEIGPGNNNNQSSTASYKPVGILMTSYGMADKSTHIDIYGGVNAKNTSSKTSGMADPNVRIGYLSGLDSYTDSAGNTRQPTGWGIYTDNGFFKGVIVADSGSIGHFTIDANSIYSGAHSAFNSNNAGIFLGRPSSSSSDYYIAGGPRDGSTTNPLWYLKSDGSAKIGAMTLSPAGILTLGSISLNASGTATIGPWIVNSTSIYKGNATQGTAGTGNMYFGNNGLSISNTFTVSNAGVLYATGADISGAITSTNGFYVKTSSTGDYIAQMTGSGISLGNAGTNGSTYTTYNIQIDPNTSTGGILLRKGTLTLNKIDSSGMTIYDGTASDDANIVANFGKTISLGRTSGSRINLNTNQFIFYDKNDSPYFELSQGATITTTILRTTTLQIAIDQTDFSGSTEYTLNSNELTAYNNNTLQVSLSGYSRRLGEASYAFETTNGTTKIKVYFYANEYVSGVSVTLKTYQTTGASEASLTFGSRKGTIGSYSVAMGLNCIASGARSFAAGEYTKAQSQGQFVIGRYNNNKTANAFEIGWGDSENTRKNIFEVNTSGNVIDGSGTQLINKAMVACGTTGGVSIGANSTAYIDVSFGKTFSSAPIVVCSLYSTSTAYSDIGKIRCWVTSVTTTGCRIYFYNQATASRAPAAYWQAMSI